MRPVTLRDLRRLASSVLVGRPRVLHWPLDQALDMVELAAGLRQPGQRRPSLAKRLAALAPVLDDLIRQHGPRAVVFPPSPEATAMPAASFPRDGGRTEPAPAAAGEAGGETGEKRETLSSDGSVRAASNLADHREGAAGGPTAADPRGSETNPAEHEAASAGAPAEGGESPTEAGDDPAEETEAAGRGVPARPSVAPEADAHAARPAELATADAGRASRAADRSNAGRPSQSSDQPQPVAAAEHEDEACAADAAHEQSRSATGLTPSVPPDGAALRPEQMIHALARRAWGPACSASDDQRLQSSIGGGQATDFAAAMRRRSLLTHADEARLRAALARLCDVLGARSWQASPKWDARALVREMVARRYALHRARQRRPLARVLILPDQSGSCAWVGDLLGQVACALAERRDDVTIAPTAWGASRHEGVIADAFGRRADDVRRLVQARGPLSSVADWQALRACGYTHALVLGDVHGHQSYEAARDAGVRVLWCDPNGETMPVNDTRGMSYVIIREATAAGLAAALERAVQMCG